MGEIRATFLDKFERFDLLLNPTTAVPAFPAGRPTTEIEGRTVDEFEGYNPFNFHANMIGHPAASVPCGFTAAGLPVGLQIIGRFGDDAGVIAASAAFEMARPWGPITARRSRALPLQRAEHDAFHEVFLDERVEQG